MIFSAASLQDFVDCRRRFQLRYLLQVAWPAIQSEPVSESERFMNQGARFHRLVQQHQLGIPAELLETLIHEDELRRWWGNYLILANKLAPAGPRYPEISLSASLAAARFTAKCDLIQRDADDRLVIYDWKTSRRRPTRSWLENRLQTRLYPELVVLAGSHLAGGRSIQPEQVEMVYWFADFPDRPERFRYDSAQLEADVAYLASLVGEISMMKSGEFTLTPQVESCRYCVYRSLCERGSQAGAMDDMEGGTEEARSFSIDFDQIAEIEF